MRGPRQLKISGVRPDPELLGRIQGHLQADGLIAYPTETVYGMGSLVRGRALTALFRLKSRDLMKPVLLLVSEDAPARGLLWTDTAKKLADAFWPGPVTLVLSDPGRAYPAGVRSAAGGVAIRMSPHPLVFRLLSGLRQPLTSTSANLTGGDPVRSGVEAYELFSEMGAGDDLWVLDSGLLPATSPSTVVDCTGDEPLVRRRGAIPTNEIFRALRDGS